MCACFGVASDNACLYTDSAWEDSSDSWSEIPIVQKKIQQDMKAIFTMIKYGEEKRRKKDVHDIV